MSFTSQKSSCRKLFAKDRTLVAQFLLDLVHNWIGNLSHLPDFIQSHDLRKCKRSIFRGTDKKSASRKMFSKLVWFFMRWRRDPPYRTRLKRKFNEQMKKLKKLETSISLKIAFFAVLYFFNLFQNILQDKRSKLFLIFEKLENLKYFEYVSGNFFFFQILKRKLNVASSCQSFAFNYVNFSSVNLILPFFYVLFNFI